jgi:tetratricopeptide (TPR) repeat protein
MGQMKVNPEQISVIARRAVQTRDWATVSACAGEILKQDKNHPEGYFLSGLAEKAAGRSKKATAAFSKAISLDAGRYDAAIELANQYLISLRHGDALGLLQQYESRLGNSPLYLDMAANTYSRLGMHARAWPLYKTANELQPGIDVFQANLAACAVYLGKIEEAKAIYCSLLERHPNHQKNHYELSRLERAKDSSHVDQMQKILETSRLAAEKNVFMYYAIGKELEDLERWQEAFHYYKLAGDAVTSVTKTAGYDIRTEIELIDKIIEVCNSDWLAAGSGKTTPDKPRKTPVFVVGLPRTGTTLTERIISSHSQVESADETFFMQLMIRRVSGIESRENMNPAIIEAAAKKDIRRIAKGYLNAVDYRLSDRPVFIDKLPENFLYLGFIAKAFPDAKMIHLRRNPMDSCFALYKQSFFKFAYTLENLGRYYVAYDRLRSHWEEVLGNRLIEVEYESLVADHEGQTRILLDKLGLDFEQACLDFDQNKTPSATASSVQVREKAHTRSVNKWKKFERQLQPLKDHLEEAGVSIE